MILDVTFNLQVYQDWCFVPFNSHGTHNTVATGYKKSRGEIHQDHGKVRGFYFAKPGKIDILKKSLGKLNPA